MEQIWRDPDLRVGYPNTGCNGTFWTLSLNLWEFLGIYSLLLMQRFLCATVGDSALLLNARGRKLLPKTRDDVDPRVKYTLGASCVM